MSTEIRTRNQENIEYFRDTSFVLGFFVLFCPCSDAAGRGRHCDLWRHDNTQCLTVNKSQTKGHVGSQNRVTPTRCTHAVPAHHYEWKKSSGLKTAAADALISTNSHTPTHRIKIPLWWDSFAHELSVGCGVCDCLRPEGCVWLCCSCSASTSNNWWCAI